MQIDDPKKYEGKRGVLIILLDEPREDGSTVDEVEASIEAASSDMVVYRRKGRGTNELIETAKLDDIKLDPPKLSKLKRRRLDPLTADKARKHLLFFHGLTLEWVNSVTDEQALAVHESEQIDHGPLGHYHAPKPPKKDGEESKSDDDADDDSTENSGED